MPRMLTFAVALGVASLSAVHSDAQQYPTRPLRLVVPFPPGGGNDISARAVSSQVESQLGQPIVIDNRGGANGIIGSQAVATAEPDGYTLLHVGASFTINPWIYKKLPFDIFRDFAPVASIDYVEGYVIVVDPKLPIHNTADLLAYARQHRLFYGSPGPGNPIQLATEAFKVAAGIELEAVPFRGTSPALGALMAGTIHLMFVPIGSALGQIQSGQLRAVAFTGEKLSSDLPAVAVIKDTVPGYTFVGSWHAWFAPANTPSAIVDRINREVRTALRSPKVVEGLRQTGSLPDEKSPAELAAFLRKDAETMAAAVRAAKMEPQ
jgi:tripartite-type tricarboxylate transporter receptor subunit TctC